MRLNFSGLCRAACLISTLPSATAGIRFDSPHIAQLAMNVLPFRRNCAATLILRPHRWQNAPVSGDQGRIARVKTQFGRLNTLKIKSLLKFVRRTNILVLLNMRISPWALPPLTWAAGKPAVFFYFFFPPAGRAFAPALSRSVAIMQQQVELMRLHSFCHNSADCPGDGAPTPPWRFPP